MRALIVFTIFLFTVSCAKQLDNTQIDGTLVYKDGNEGTMGECLISSDTDGTVIWDTCGGGGGGSVFDDSVFNVEDQGGDSFGILFDVSAATADRTITFPDTAINMADIATNTAHSSGDGSDHSDVALNTTHRSSSGTDHSDVGLNNTHRTGDGSDHADVASNTSSISGHLNGGVSKHDLTEIDYERVDGSKKNIDAASDDGETAITDLDDAIGALAGSPTNYTPSDATIVADHLAGIDTALAAAGGATTELDNLGTTNINASLFFDTDASYNIGVAGGNRVSSVNAAGFDADSFYLLKTSGQTTRLVFQTGQTCPSGTSCTIIEARDSQPLGVTTDSVSSTTNAQNILIEGGNSVDGIGGNITVRGGVASGTGSDGTITMDGNTEIEGELALEQQTTDTITADNTEVAVTRSHLQIASDSGTATDRSFYLGTADAGTIVCLTFTGPNAAEILDDTSGMRLAGTLTLGSLDSWCGIRVGSDWIELSRSDN